VALQGTRPAVTLRRADVDNGVSDDHYGE
jgi:hypothetical protein